MDSNLWRRDLGISIFAVPQVPNKQMRLSSSALPLPPALCISAQCPFNPLSWTFKLQGTGKRLFHGNEVFLGSAPFPYCPRRLKMKMVNILTLRRQKEGLTF